MARIPFNQRIGDLRLACAAQMEMAKAEGLKFRAKLATASLFGFNVCDKLEGTKVEAPKAGPTTRASATR